MIQKKPPKDHWAESDEKLLTDVENDQFLRVLRKHHPNGPLTYSVRAGVARVINPIDVRGGSSAGMCADAV